MGGWDNKNSFALRKHFHLATELPSRRHNIISSNAEKNSELADNYGAAFFVSESAGNKSLKKEVFEKEKKGP